MVSWETHGQAPHQLGTHQQQSPGSRTHRVQAKRKLSRVGDRSTLASLRVTTVTLTRRRGSPLSAREAPCHRGQGLVLCRASLARHSGSRHYHPLSLQQAHSPLVAACTGPLARWLLIPGHRRLPRQARPLPPFRLDPPENLCPRTSCHLSLWWSRQPRPCRRSQALVRASPPCGMSSPRRSTCWTCLQALPTGDSWDQHLVEQLIKQALAWSWGTACWTLRRSQSKRPSWPPSDRAEWLQAPPKQPSLLLSQCGRVWCGALPCHQQLRAQQSPAPPHSQVMPGQADGLQIHRWGGPWQLLSHGRRRLQRLPKPAQPGALRLSQVP